MACAHSKSKSKLQQVYHLIRNEEKLTDGQMTVVTEEVDQQGDRLSFPIIVKPNGGPWKGGTFRFLIEIADKIRVTCLTAVSEPDMNRK